MKLIGDRHEYKALHWRARNINQMPDLIITKTVVAYQTEPVHGVSLFAGRISVAEREAGGVSAHSLSERR